MMRYIRHVVTALAVGLGVTAVVGTPAGARADHRGHADVPATAEPVSFDDLRDLVSGFEAAGEVTFAGARRLEICLVLAQHSVDRGTPAAAIPWLEQFKATASQPRYVPSESARAVLIAGADELIVLLSGPASAAPDTER